MLDICCGDSFILNHISEYIDDYLGVDNNDEYLKKCRNKGINVEVSPLCDFVTWADGLGYQNLLLLKSNRSFSVNFFKNFKLSISQGEQNQSILIFLQ